MLLREIGVADWKRQPTSPTLSEGKEEECISKKPIPGAVEFSEGSLTKVSASQWPAAALAEGVYSLEVHMQQ